MPKSNKKFKKIYLDYAASASANPSSLHFAGVDARKKLEYARKGIGNILGARTEEIIFTSGGTESNNLAIQGVILKFWELSFQKKSKFLKLPHIITTNIEHPSVLETCKLLQKRKLAQISVVPVERNGIVDPRKIKKEIKKNTVLVSIAYANNEIGAIQPIREIAKEIRHWKKRKNDFLETVERDGASTRNFSAEKYPYSEKSFFPFFHTDAVQAVNYLDLNVEKLGVDLLSLSGSKIEESGRVGVLYKRKFVSLASVFGGGDQEFGLRPGTENLPAILKFSEALQLAQKDKEKETKRLTKLRDYFLKQLITSQKNNFLRSSEKIPRPFENYSSASLVINGDLKNRLQNNINISFPKIPSDLLVIELSAKGIMASSKSACKSSRKEGSYVIQAIHPESNPEVGGVRFSLGKQTTKQDIDYTIKSLFHILQKLKKWYN